MPGRARHHEAPSGSTLLPLLGAGASDAPDAPGLDLRYAGEVGFDLEAVEQLEWRVEPRTSALLILTSTRATAIDSRSPAVDTRVRAVGDALRTLLRAGIIDADRAGDAIAALADAGLMAPTGGGPRDVTSSHD